jgi:hypothetical protein
VTGLGMADAAVLEITDAAGTLRFPLTGPPRPGSRLIVDNKFARTRYEHISLGRFGYAHVWLTLRAGLQQIDAVELAHGRRTGDAFSNANHPAGDRWVLISPTGGQNGARSPTTGPASHHSAAPRSRVPILGASDERPVQGPVVLERHGRLEPRRAGRQVQLRLITANLTRGDLVRNTQSLQPWGTWFPGSLWRVRRTTAA